ncbi:MAG TPA: hypothetical protein VN083_03115, partial [Vicinamibacteria bacterium]|nr:hypothetical protein [Vicinamibacteria bacterium]
DDPAARDLLKAALASAEPFKRVELWDPREAPLPRPDTDFPKLGTSAAYLCAQGRCSAPAKTPEALRERLARLNAASHPSF